MERFTTTAGIGSDCWRTVRRSAAALSVLGFVAGCSEGSDPGSDSTALTPTTETSNSASATAKGPTNPPPASSPSGPAAVTPSATTTDDSMNGGPPPATSTPASVIPLPSASNPTAEPQPSGDAGSSSGGSGGAPPMSSGGEGGTPEAGGTSGTGGLGTGGEGVGGEANVGGMMGNPAGDTPCPTDGSPCKILPLGDSITDGIGFSGGYRVELFRQALAAGKNITYVGGSMNGPNDVDGETFPKNHEGHSGWTVQQIADIVPAPALDGDPHIILLHIGTNDMYQMPEGAPDRLDALIDELVADNPEALLVVSNIIPFPGNGSVDSYNGDIESIIMGHIDAGENVLFVDQFAGFPESELGDGVHPNQAGYERMAGKWWEAIESYLP